MKRKFQPRKGWILSHEKTETSSLIIGHSGAIEVCNRVKRAAAETPPLQNREPYIYAALHVAHPCSAALNGTEVKSILWTKWTEGGSWMRTNITWHACIRLHQDERTCDTFPLFLHYRPNSFHSSLHLFLLHYITPFIPKLFFPSFPAAFLPSSLQPSHPLLRPVSVSWPLVEGVLKEPRRSASNRPGFAICR